MIDSPTIHLFPRRFWTDKDSRRFLDDPKALGLDPKAFTGRVVYIANGCLDGRLLADVVDALRGFGATKIQLGTLKRERRASILRLIEPRGRSKRARRH